MRLRSKEAVPDHWRRAVRLSLATGLLAALGFSLASQPTYRRGPVLMITKWALITLPVVTMPLLGKTSQVGAERILGTVLGGVLGFLAAAVATNWWTLQATESGDLFLAAATAAASFLSVLAGKRFNLDLSARLFVIAFIIVSYNVLEGKDPFQVAVTRICGITAGVLTMLCCSVFIMPKSASIESLRTLRKALMQLREINGLVWDTYLPGTHPAKAQQPAAAAVAPAASGMGAKGPGARPAATPGGGSKDVQRGQRGVSDSALQRPLLGPEDGEDVEAGQLQGAPAAGSAAAGLPTAGAAAAATVACVDGSTGVAVLSDEEHEAVLLKSEKALTELYSLLDTLEEQLGLAKREVFVANCNGHPFLLPGMPFWGASSNHLPWTELEAAANSVRRVARLLNTAMFAFEDGFEQQLREVLGPHYPADLLPRLAAGADAAIQDLCVAFPFETEASSSGLAALNAAVAGLAAVSDQQRREVVRALRRYRTRSAARASWATAIDAALREAAAPFATVGSAPATPGGWGPRHRPAELPPPGAGPGTSRFAAEQAAVASSAGPASPAQGAGNDTAAQEAGAEAGGAQSTAAGEGEGATQAGAAGAPARDPASPRLLASFPVPLLGVEEAGLGSPGIPSHGLFPDTAEGRLAQVAWYSFQFLSEELAEQLAGLHGTVNAVLRRLPE